MGEVAFFVCAATQNYVCGGKEPHRFLCGHTDFCVAPKMDKKKKLCEKKKYVQVIAGNRAEKKKICENV